MKSEMKIVFIALAVCLAVVMLAVSSVQSVRNRAVRLEEQIVQAVSDIDVQQKRRGDLIPNLVECVKAYDRHEYETLLAVVQARGTATDAAASEALTMIAAVAEAYPELQSSANYRELMNELSTTENLMAKYRGNYNKQVRAYKQYVRRFPNNALLGLSGYDTVGYNYLDFDAPEDAPAVNFG